VEGGFGYLIMMFIIIYGNMVMRSVIEEKTNRIIEIISSVKPFQLMIGKIIGTSLAGILQFLYGL
jgi:ABC-2 type transport system permease protein